MEATLKALKEYTVWKNGLKKVLDKNLDEMIDLIVDAGGYNTLIPLSTAAKNDYPSPIFPPLSNQFLSSSYPPIEILKQIRQGVVINALPNSAKKLLWYLDHQRFFLINPDSSTPLNISPTYTSPPGYAHVFTNGQFVSCTDNQIAFLLSLMDWLPELQTILMKRMNSINPEDIASKIKCFSAAIKANTINFNKAHTE
ncbi:MULTISPECIES: hypothetical protein [Pseudomonas]|uniref:hypothetical protein n=1 Tax=Pseudomonas TaxID=286 RepID=UPI000A08EB9E|nr:MULTISPECIES: hypothetical protein [unclassified Pseudomonas]SMF08701.1 hypothetical protein SAMN05660912_01459 [Pseudomonas sp. LAMO17WK12:I1]